jgi:hypothetical protein
MSRRSINSHLAGWWTALIVLVLLLYVGSMAPLYHLLHQNPATYAKHYSLIEAVRTPYMWLKETSLNPGLERYEDWWYWRISKYLGKGTYLNPAPASLDPFAPAGASSTAPASGQTPSTPPLEK